MLFIWVATDNLWFITSACQASNYGTSVVVTLNVGIFCTLKGDFSLVYLLTLPVSFKQVCIVWNACEGTGQGKILRIVSDRAGGPERPWFHI